MSAEMDRLFVDRHGRVFILVEDIKCSFVEVTSARTF